MKTIEMVREAVKGAYPPGNFFNVGSVCSCITEYHGVILNKTQVYRALKALRRQGEIKVVKRDKRGLLYTRTNWLDWWRRLFE